jgi:hypothetical protein
MDQELRICRFERRVGEITCSACMRDLHACRSFL